MCIENGLQCELINVRTTQRVTAFVPRKYAEKGKILQIKKRNDEWGDEWRVVLVYEPFAAPKTVQFRESVSSA